MPRPRPSITPRPVLSAPPTRDKVHTMTAPRQPLTTPATAIRIGIAGLGRSGWRNHAHGHPPRPTATAMNTHTTVEIPEMIALTRTKSVRLSTDTILQAVEPNSL